MAVSSSPDMEIKIGVDTGDLGKVLDAAKSRVASFGTELQSRFSKATGASEGLEKSLRSASDSMSRAKNELANVGTATTGLRAIESEADRAKRKLDNISYFLWENTSLSGPNIDRVVGPLKYLIGTIGVLPTAIAAASVAVAGFGAYLAHVAQSQLAEFANAIDRIGVSVTELKGAQITFAKFGVDADHTTEAMKNAAEQFAQYRRNAGAVKDALEKFDEGFLKVADRAKTTGEFIDIIAQKIRALPHEEGLDLAKALFGDDAGLKLFEPLAQGSAAMSTFRDAAKEAGVAIKDGAAKHAQELRETVEQAAEVANGKFLTAMQAMGDPIAQIKIGWYGIVGAISDAIAKAGEFIAAIERATSQLRGTIALLKSSLGMAHEANGKSFENTFGKYRHVKVGTEEEGPPMAPSALGSGEAGVSRKRFEAYDASSSGSGRKGGAGRGASEAAAAERAKQQGEIEAVKWGLTQKLALYDHEAKMKEISEEQKVAFTKAAIDEEYAAERELLQKELDIDGQKPAQRQQVLNKIEALEREHVAKIQQLEWKAAEETQQKWEQTFQQIGSTLAGSLQGVLNHTKNFKDVMRDLLGSISQMAIQDLTKRASSFLATTFKNVLDGATKQSQTAGKDIADGLEKPTEGLANGLQGSMSTAFEGIKSMFSSVLEGISGLLKNFLEGASSLIGSLFKGIGSIGSSVASALPSFDVGAWDVGQAGNVDGKRGFPALVHPGEMIVPAAQAAQLRSALASSGMTLAGLSGLALAMPGSISSASAATSIAGATAQPRAEAPPVTIHNYAPGLVIKPDITRDGVTVMIREAIAGNNKRQGEADRRGPA